MKINKRIMFPKLWLYNTTGRKLRKIKSAIETNKRKH
jgi:hypothetical protein